MFWPRGMFIPMSFALSDILWKCTFTSDLISCLKSLKSFKEGDTGGGCSGLAVKCCISVEIFAAMSFIVADFEFCPLSRVFRCSSNVSLCCRIFSISSARDSRLDCVLWTILRSGVTATGFWWWDWVWLLLSGVVVCGVKVDTVVFCVALIAVGAGSVVTACVAVEGFRTTWDGEGLLIVSWEVSGSVWAVAAA